MAERHPLKRFSQNGDSTVYFHSVNGKIKRNGNVPLKVYCKTSSSVQGRSLVFKMVMCIVVACFVVQAMLQRSMMMSFKAPEGGNPGKFRVSLRHQHQNQGLSKFLYRFNVEEPAKFVPHRLFQKFRDKVEEAKGITGVTRIPLRAPRLALVSHELSRNPNMLLLLTVARGLQELGYDLQVRILNLKKIVLLEDGPLRDRWESFGISVCVIGRNASQLSIDWLNFEGVVVSSIEAKPVMSSLMQEPFDSVPLLWIVHEKTLGVRVKSYDSDRHGRIIEDWKQAFYRAEVVIFSDYTLPMLHSVFDSGNFFVIPGSPIDVWEAEDFMTYNIKSDLRLEMNFSSNDFIIAIVGSQFYTTGTWKELALIMQALSPLISEFRTNSTFGSLRLVIVNENLNNSYEAVLQVISHHFGFPNGTVNLASENTAEQSVISIADLVVYASQREEQAFPAVLIKAMSLGKVIVVPSITVIQQHIVDKIHGFLYPTGSAEGITKSIALAVSEGMLSVLAREISSTARELARHLLVADAIETYAAIIEKIIHLPSEVSTPKHPSNIPEQLKRCWQWELLGDPKLYSKDPNKSSVVLEVEQTYTYFDEANSTSRIDTGEGSFNYSDWEMERAISIAQEAQRREEEELDERRDRVKKTWEDVYRIVKRAERTKGELHERDDGELERTGQPICIYEPYFGQGAWPFLHRHSLYRGIGLSTRGRRPGTDDIDAPARLPILNNAYYRDSLCEFAAFFALANRVDRIHKNSWIGFQSWRAAGRNASLSQAAERRLVDAIQSRRHGSALYFWARMDKDGPTSASLSNQDFWSYCEAVNAGNCRKIFSDAFRSMYSLPNTWKAVPPMPHDGDSWSVLHSWALPTKSFLEFVMFSRMFVDALDAQHYQEHHDNGKCCLSISKDTHCYCRLLELLINVWSYHSARKIIYINPATGHMQEHHRVKTRRGRMWAKWFSPTFLKSMDEDLAEEFDTEKTFERRLWPSTGEVYWRGIYERERNYRNRLKIEKKKKSRDKLVRMRSRYRQKALGKYIRPPPDQAPTNTTNL